MDGDIHVSVVRECVERGAWRAAVSCLGWMPYMLGFRSIYIRLECGTGLAGWYVCVESLRHISSVNSCKESRLQPLQEVKLQ